MSRKKKKQSPQERRAQEKQRRIEAAGKQRQPKPEKPPARVPGPAPAAGGRPEPETRPHARMPKAPRRKPVPARVDNPRYKSLQFGDGQPAGGDCTRYELSFPARMDIQALFDVIRKERRDEHGTVYISLNLADSGAGNHQLSYDYAGGMFTRREKPSKDKAAPLLADLLGRPVTKIRACGGWGVMDYYVNIRPADSPDEDADARPYDPSEIIRDA